MDGVGGSKSCSFQGEGTEAGRVGVQLSQQSGTARKPCLACTPDLLATEESPLNALPPIREKQQPAPRLTLRDLQNKSSCSSLSSGATSLLHTVSPEPPGPPQQPTPTELSLANVTVPLESIKPSE